MGRRKSFIIMMSIFFYLFLTYSLVVSFADELKIGTEAPFFRVKSGDEKVLEFRYVRENSKKEGITIYGYGDSKIFSNYKMKDKESSVFSVFEVKSKCIECWAPFIRKRYSACRTSLLATLRSFYYTKKSQE